MVQTCPICREVVHVSAGYFTRHGSRSHGIFQLCSGSGSPVYSLCDSCG